MLDARFEVHKDKTLREATEMAWKVRHFLYFFDTKQSLHLLNVIHWRGSFREKLDVRINFNV